MTTMFGGVEELRAAYHALHRPDDQPGEGPAQPPLAGIAHPSTTHRLVLVTGVAGGAGTTMMALGLAEALGAAQLVELASPPESGLSEATSAELGAIGGWNTGHRATGSGDLRVYRSLHPDTPLPTADPAGRRTVVDVGVWPAPDGLLEVGQGLVVVAACSVPGARRLEATLQELCDRGNHPESFPVLVGAPGRGCPTPVRAVFGPQLRAAHTSGRLHLIPAHPTLRIGGLTAAPLPKPIQQAAAALAQTLKDSHVD